MQLYLNIQQRKRLPLSVSELTLLLHLLIIAENVAYGHVMNKKPVETNLSALFYSSFCLIHTVRAESGDVIELLSF